MAIISATAVSTYAPKISISAGSIISGNYIPVVQERLCLMLNNYFCSDDLSLISTCKFDATARSITLTSNTEYWENYGFKSGDDFLVYRSYRNDSVKTIESLSNNVLVVTSSCSVIDERFNNSDGAAIYFSVVQWPISVVAATAKMIWFDADYRDKNPSYLKSRSLGPLSESFGSSETDDMYGYPIKIIQSLDFLKIARFN
jgi:hypothetical protein